MSRIYTEQSSAVEYFQLDEKSGELEVSYRGSALPYRFKVCDGQFYADLCNSPSIGSALSSAIRVGRLEPIGKVSTPTPSLR